MARMLDRIYRRGDAFTVQLNAGFWKIVAAVGFVLFVLAIVLIAVLVASAL